MANRAKLFLAVLFVFIFKNAIHGRDNSRETQDEVCSSYSFDDYSSGSRDWETARDQCSKRAERGLVSMESEEEWKYLMAIVKSPNKSIKGDRWYIGLKKSSHKWCWLSNTSGCVSDTSFYTGEWRWDSTEPNNPETEHCVEMLKDGSYNNVACNKSYSYSIGYICEKRVACSNAFSDNVFKIQKSTVQPFITKKKQKRRSDTQPTFNQKSTVQPSTYETTLSVNITVIILSVLVVILLVMIGFILWRKGSPRNAGAGIQNNRVVRTNQPQSRENLNDTADSVNNAVIIAELNEESQQTRHARVQRHYASLNQATMMEQTGVFSFAAIERTEMEEMNHGHSVDYLNEMQLNEDELDRPAYMNFTVTSHDYINV